MKQLCRCSESAPLKSRENKMLSSKFNKGWSDRGWYHEPIMGEKQTLDTEWKNGKGGDRLSKACIMKTSNWEQHSANTISAPSLFCENMGKSFSSVAHYLWISLLLEPARSWAWTSSRSIVRPPYLDRQGKAMILLGMRGLAFVLFLLFCLDLFSSFLFNKLFPSLLFCPEPLVGGEAYKSN